MFCNQCGKQIAQNSKFCNFCGANQTTGGDAVSTIPTQPQVATPTLSLDDGRERVVKEAGTHIMKAGPSALMAQRKIVVTNRRVIYREGIIGKQERSIPLNKITDVQISYSVSGRLAGYGTLRIESASSGETEIVAEDIADARGVRDVIMKLIR